MSRETLDCGCVSDGTHWLVQCPAHAAEGAEYHAAMMEHRSVRPVTNTDNYEDLLS